MDRMDGAKRVLSGAAGKRGGRTEHFIQHAIKRPGALHKRLGVPIGEPIPREKLEEAGKAPGLEGKEARFAEMLEHLHHGKAPKPEHVKEFGY